MSKNAVKDEPILKVESAVKQMIKLGEIDKELFEKYYEEVTE